MVYTVDEQSTERALRWIADAYEQAQRVRVQTGERIRAVAQGRDETWGIEVKITDPAGMLRQIRKGETDGPVALLGRTYRRHWEEEQEMSRSLGAALRTHPAWPWLCEVRGIGPTLAGKLVARLDVERADTPSAFWAYCGLATVPGIRYHCDICGLSRSLPEHHRISPNHPALHGRGDCSGELRRAAGPGDGVRVAQPKPRKGERIAYDATAKKICYLIGTSFIKAGGAYEQFYRHCRARLDDTRPGWVDGRKHLTALRKTEKLFLAHLWLVWRTACGLPLTAPYAEARLGHDCGLDPWDFAEPAAG
jgi:hypothetical protein